MNAMRVLVFTAMRNSTPSPTAALNGSHMGWRAPALYLFMAIVCMLALIGFASVLLVCTWCRLAAAATRNTTQSSPRLEFIESAPMKMEILGSNDAQELYDKVLVIMPGDQQPKFLAKQMASVDDVNDDDRG